MMLKKEAILFSAALLALAAALEAPRAEAKKFDAEKWDAELQYNEAYDNVSKECNLHCHVEYCRPAYGDGGPNGPNHLNQNCGYDESKTKDYFTSLKNGSCDAIPLHLNPETYPTEKRGWDAYVGQEVVTADCVPDYTAGNKFDHKLELKRSEIKPSSGHKSKSRAACAALAEQAANNASKEDPELFHDFKDRGGLLRFTFNDTTTMPESKTDYGPRPIPYQRCPAGSKGTKVCRAYHDVFDFDLGPSADTKSIVTDTGAIKPVLDIRVTLAPSGDGQTSCLVPNDEAIRAAVERYMQIKSPLAKAVGRFLEMNISRKGDPAELAEGDGKAETELSNPVLRDRFPQKDAVKITGTVKVE